jgi:hypothetical protein
LNKSYINKKYSSSIQKINKKSFGIEADYLFSKIILEISFENKYYLFSKI